MFASVQIFQWNSLTNFAGRRCSYEDIVTLSITILWRQIYGEFQNVSPRQTGMLLGNFPKIKPKISAIEFKCPQIIDTRIFFQPNISHLNRNAVLAFQFWLSTYLVTRHLPYFYYRHSCDSIEKRE